MKIINETKKIVLAENANLADTAFKRIKGLIGRRSLRDGEALIIKPCNSIHTFFMFQKIDVVMTDEFNNIVYLKENVSPFSLIKTKKKAKSTYEFPLNTIKKYNLKI